MSDVNPSTAHLTSNMAGDNMASFYDEVGTSPNMIHVFLYVVLFRTDFLHPREHSALQ
jgi:hypothetical protein